MERLKEFKNSINESSLIDKAALLKINGKLATPKTSSWTETNSAGCTLYVTDSFDDLNGDGQRNCNEPGVLTINQDCGNPCPPAT